MCLTIMRRFNGLLIISDGDTISFRINIIEVVNISSNELGSKNDEVILAEFYDDSYTYIMKRRNWINGTNEHEQ